VPAEFECLWDSSCWTSKHSLWGAAGRLFLQHLPAFTWRVCFGTEKVCGISTSSSYGRTSSCIFPPSERHTRTVWQAIVRNACNKIRVSPARQVCFSMAITVAGFIHIAQHTAQSRLEMQNVHTRINPISFFSSIK